MRLITWNVARRLEKLPAQAAAIAARGPDVVALQEVTTAGAPFWRQALTRIGLPSIRFTLDEADPAREPPTRRRTGILLAARDPQHPAARAAEPPWPETVLSADLPDVRIHAAHVPNAANGQIKVRTLQAIRAMAEGDARPVIVCGDLNTPRRETPDGIVTFARDSRARLRPARGEEWDEAELALLDGRTGLVDAFRALHPDARDVSWAWPHGGGWRLDHVIVSADIEVQACGYHHDWRTGGLSDHSALEADLRPPPRASGARR